MSIEKNWHLLLVRANWEKKIIDSLNKRGIETFFPLTIIKKSGWIDKKNQMTSPVFPCHLFVNICSKQDFLSVQQTKGVLNFFYNLDMPAIISIEDINTIRIFLNVYENVSFEKGIMNTLSEGQQHEELSVQKGDKIFLPSIGYYIMGQLSEVNDPKILHVERTESTTENFYLVAPGTGKERRVITVA